MSERPLSPHAGHDLELVAALVSGEVERADQRGGQALVASCTACSELLADLKSIAMATRTLPAPERMRDFRLRAEDAARLRPRGLRRVAAALGASRLELARPLAPALMTLGIVGLLISASPLVSFGFGSSGAALGPAYSSGSDAVSGAAAASAAPSPASAAPSQENAAPSKAALVPAASAIGSDAAVFGGLKSSPSGLGDTAGEQTVRAASTAAPEVSVASGELPPGPQPNVALAVVSVLVLLTGLVLLVLRRAARSA